MSGGIYYLKDLNGNVRYVGQAVNFNRRFSQHISSARKGARSHVYNWIRSQGFNVSMEIVEETDNLNERESFHIKMLTDKGVKLCNLTSGGDLYPDDPVYSLSRLMKCMFGVKSNAYLISRKVIDVYLDCDSRSKDILKSNAERLLGDHNG